MNLIRQALQGVCHPDHITSDPLPRIRLLTFLYALIRLVAVASNKAKKMLDINFVPARQADLSWDENNILTEAPLNGCSFMIPANINPNGLTLADFPNAGTRHVVGWYGKQEVWDNRYLGDEPGIIGVTQKISITELYQQLQAL